MPSVRSPVFKYYAYIVILILWLGEIILIYSYCTEKKLVYITIIAPFSCQTLSYLKYTKLNMHLSCNI